jgi:MFS family permease
VASLGYFVDIYDLVLFSIVRIPSLKSLGLQDTALVDKGVFLLNMQMAGMLIGGILWGTLGDKGRMKIMFGSIFLYSAANIANGMVQSWRPIRGPLYRRCGLAGELGAGITLVSEILHRKRGYGTMVVASSVSGAVVANRSRSLFLAARLLYRRVLGFLLLILRISVHESGMFRGDGNKQVTEKLFALFTDKNRFANTSTQS